MLVIRRLVDRHRAYTGIFLPGEPAQIFPTSEFEHGRILQIYKQDKAYEARPIRAASHACHKFQHRILRLSNRTKSPARSERRSPSINGESAGHTTKAFLPA